MEKVYSDLKRNVYNETIEVEAGIDIFRKAFGFFKRPRLTAHGMYLNLGKGYAIVTPAGAKKCEIECHFVSGGNLIWLANVIHKAEKKQAKLG